MPWDPQLHNLLPIHAEVLAMMELGTDGEITTDEDPPPNDPILAAYVMPKLPELEGLQWQTDIFKELQSRADAAQIDTSNPPESPAHHTNGVVMFDPMGGMNMPRA